MAGQGVGEVGGVVAGIEQDQRRRVAGLPFPVAFRSLSSPVIWPIVTSVCSSPGRSRRASMGSTQEEEPHWMPTSRL